MGVKLWTGVVIVTAVVAGGLTATPPPAIAASPTTETTALSTASAGLTDQDLAVDGVGAGDGYHVRVATSRDGYAWRDIAVLRPADLDPGSWLGYQCATADGRFVAVAVLPGDAVNLTAARDRGAYAYSVDVASGKVLPLASGVGFKYHSPGCGLTDQAAFTADLGSDESQTETLSFNMATGRRTSDSIVRGQVTSVVPTSEGLIGAQASALVKVPTDGGTTSKPATARPVKTVDGSAYDLRPNAVGGVDFLLHAGGAKAQAFREHKGTTSTLGEGSLRQAALFTGSGGHTMGAGLSASRGASLQVVDAHNLPNGLTTVSLHGGAAFGAAAPTPAKTHRTKVSSTASSTFDGSIVEKLSTHKVTRAAIVSSSTKPVRASGKGGTSLEPAASGETAAPSEHVKPALYTGVGPVTASIAVARRSAQVSTASTSTPKCSVPRLQPTLQAMQPSNAQVTWATQMAEQGLLTGSAYTRPSNFANMGLAAYAPSSDFPPIALHHPSSDTWNTVPRSVMLAIEAQESNFNQASWHALPGIAADPLIASYYGAGDSISTIDYPDADCGYGVAQVTNGMATSDTSISANGQKKIAVDYQENIAAGLNILQSTWNQLYDAGITANGGDPKYLENWYLAIWAYNTGVQPTSRYGNTTGCTPSPTCTGPDGTWGLGWSNNPQNPDYSPSRQPYLKSTYADAAHPASWPYQERVLGWMASPIIRYSYLAYDTPAYHGGSTWVQPAPYSTFCTSGNDCSTSASGYCTLSDSECWWHSPVTWIASCSTTCATSSYQYSSGSTEPTYSSPYPPTCTIDSSVLPSSAIIVDDLATPSQNLQGCSGGAWTNKGSFAYTPGSDSAGNPVGNIDTHQLGSGLGGHILFTHTEPASSTSLINTGTWTPTLPSLQYYKVKIHLPASGATATDVVYTINPGGGVSPWKIRVNQAWHSEQWVTIGTFAMQNGGSVSLSNASSMTPQGYDVAYDAVAFVPEGGTPGTPIGGPPGIKDAPKGSNPAWVNCGCVRRTAGDPVDTSTGAFGESVTDASLPGEGISLTVDRSYASSLADPSGPNSALTINGPFGYGWTYNYGLTASTTSGSVTITQEDGSQVAFTSNSDGTYSPTIPRYDATLTKSGSSYVFTRRGQEAFTFDVTSGRLTALSDLAGRVASTPYGTTLSYDSSNHLSTVTDPSGRKFTFTWTGARITKVVTAANQEVDYSYSAAGDLTDVYGIGTVRTSGVNGDQDHLRYAYNSNHLMTSERSAANFTRSGSPATVNTYDSSDRVVSQIDPNGNKTSWVYGPDSTSGLTAGQTLVTDPAGHKVLDTYTNGLLTSETKGYGATGASTWSYTYDPLTLGVSVQTNPDGSTQTFAYDDHGNRVSSSDALGRTTSYSYNSTGQMTQSIDPTGLTTTTSYNAAGMPTAIQRSAAGASADSPNDTLNPSYARQTTSTYSTTWPDEVATKTDPNGNVTTYSWDGFGDVTSTTDPAGNITKRAYDTTLGQLKTVVSPRGTAAGTATSCTPPAIGCTTYAYDAFGNRNQTTNPLGATSKATFDADGNQLSTTDGNGHTATTTYDADGRPTTATKASGSTSSTAYNPDGTIHSTTDGNGKTVTYSYDAQARVTSRTNANSKATTYTYDSLGRQVTSTSPSGTITTLGYDNAGEVTSETYSGGTTTPGVTFTYDLDGRRASMTDGTGTTTYSHDAFGETASVTNGAGSTIGYSYDANGNTTAISYPGTIGKVTRKFNNLNELTTVTDPSSRATTFAYNADQDLSTSTFGNGDTSTVAYDNADQAQTTTLKQGTMTLGALAYTRDSDGELLGETGSGAIPGNSTTYAYTADQTLKSSTTGGTSTTYAYDNAGNLTTYGSTTQVFDPTGALCWTTTAAVTGQTCSSPSTGATTYATNPDGQRTAKTPTTGTASTYSWNAAGELTGVAGAATAAYTYNGDRLRMSKTTGGTTQSYTWDTTSAVPRLLSDGTTTYIYGPTGTAVEQINAGTPSYYFTNAHGSTAALTAADGTVAGTYSYGAWGNVLTHTGISVALQFGGWYADAETGFAYLDARYYDPSTASFLSVDDLVAVTLSAYQYANDDPLNQLDPLGLWSWGDTWTVVAMVGIGIGIAAATISVVGAEADLPLGAAEAGLGTGLAADVAAEDAAASAAEAAASGPRFVTTGNGTTYDIPEGWQYRLANNGKGSVYQRPGADGNADSIRIMDPTERYPEGYARYYNEGGQPMNFRTGKPNGTQADFHVPSTYCGHYLGWPQ